MTNGFRLWQFHHHGSTPPSDSDLDCSGVWTEALPDLEVLARTDPIRIRSLLKRWLRRPMMWRIRHVSVNKGTVRLQTPQHRGLQV